MSTPRVDGSIDPAADTESGAGRRLGMMLVWTLGAIAAIAVVSLIIFSPEGVRLSSDPGAPVTPLWTVILPPLVAVVLIRVLPLRAPELPPVIHDRRAIERSTLILCACAVAFPLIIGVADLNGSELYFLVKIVILLAVPAALLWRTRRAIQIPHPQTAWQWWPPIVVVAVWTWLSQAAPWLPAPTFSWPDPILVIVGATLTLLTAGVGEEIFYRRWLQTRLEALLGRWGGIAGATLAFSAMHLGGDRQGSGMFLEIAAAIVVQGSFGFMLGYLWSRYRNLWLAIAAHAIANGYGVVTYFLSL